MRLEHLRTITESDVTKACATVTWEDCDRPSREVFIATPAVFGDDLRADPNAFLVAAIMPALRHGERRVLVDGAVCPKLRNGLITAMQQLQYWHGDHGHALVTIEATEGFAPPVPTSRGRTASFMSGGIDALATLRGNRLDFPPDHPGFLRDCLFLHGVDVGAHEQFEQNRESFESSVASLSELARAERFTLIPVYSNLRYLDDDDIFVHLYQFGAALAAVAHAFSRRISRGLIASSDSVQGGLVPMGSHPLLDPNYSSAAVDIEHDGIRLSRLDKIRLISQWQRGLQHVRSCFDCFRPPGVLNCGRCEKCIRTMTGLLACGALKDCGTYPLDDVSPDLLQTLETAPMQYDPEKRRQWLKQVMTTLNYANQGSWRSMIPPLEELGRHDLVEVIKAKLAAYEAHVRAHERCGMGRLKRFDDRWLRGTLATLARLLRS